MAKEKEVAEQPEKEAPLAVDDKAETPKKKDGPQRAPLAAALHTAKGPAPVADRARAVAAMQREIGNARVANALAGTEPAAMPETEAPGKKNIPEPGSVKASDAETGKRAKQP